MEELGRLEMEPANLEARLGDPAHTQRTPQPQLDDERQFRNELRARVEALREELSKRAPPAEQGGLPAPQTGLWAPLVLHVTPPEESELPTFDVEDAPPEPDLEVVSREIAALVRGKRPGFRSLAEVMKRWRTDARILRLAGAALWTLGVRELAQLGAPPLRLPFAETRHVTDVAWWMDSLGVPDESHGLTREEWRLLRLLREAAPPARPFVGLRELAVELGVPLPEFERALIGLGHPSLRRFPLVEFQGFTGRFTPPDTHVTHARLTRTAVEVLDDVFPLPLVLLNGAAGSKTCIPPHRAAGVLEALLAVIASPRPTCRTVLDHLRFEWPEGAFTADSQAQNFWCRGAGRLITRAQLALESDSQGERGRLIISHFPWPMRAADVKASIQQLRREGCFDGVTSIEDESSATAQRLVLNLEHVAFTGPVREALTRARLLEQSFDAELLVETAGGVRRTDVVDLLAAFVEARKEAAVRRLDAEVRRASQQAARAEAVVVALALLEPVLAVMREALDDAEAIAGLQRFMRPEWRATLVLPAPLSHAYDAGFTEDQARHLVSLRKLAYRRRDAAQADWAAALGAVEVAKARLSDRAEMLELVRQELVAARERFVAG
ncbi:MAG: DNA gyrase subunit A [Myxococcota bacterium]